MLTVLMKFFNWHIDDFMACQWSKLCKNYNVTQNVNHLMGLISCNHLLTNVSFHYIPCITPRLNYYHVNPLI